MMNVLFGELLYSCLGGVSERFSNVVYKINKIVHLVASRADIPHFFTALHSFVYMKHIHEAIRSI